MSLDQVTRTIFLADDDPDDCMLFEEALMEIDKASKITVANDGVHLMNILKQEIPTPPSMIFIDINMPRKNGLECLKEIKKMDKLKHIPVVVYSTSCQVDTIKQMYELGASYYICKPDSFQKLIKSISKIFSVDNTPALKPSLKEFTISF